MVVLHAATGNIEANYLSFDRFLTIDVSYDKIIFDTPIMELLDG
jgi:hypothetical protein